MLVALNSMLKLEKATTKKQHNLNKQPFDLVLNHTIQPNLIIFPHHRFAESITISHVP